jgi:hypothetical protein
VYLDAFGPDSLPTKVSGLKWLNEKQNIPLHLLVSPRKRAGSNDLISTKVNTYRQFNRNAPLDENNLY